MSTPYSSSANDFVLSLMIVESDPFFQRFLATAMDKLGYHFTVVNEGSEALVILDRERISVVLLGIPSRGYAGLDLLNHISVHYPETDIIAVAALQQDFSLTSLIDAGAVDYLQKPFTIDEVKAKLNRLIRERKLIHELVVENRKRLQTEAELRKSQEELEKRVQLRTAELEMAKIAAEEATAAQSEFMANISHELRTPMHGILSFARLGANKIELVDKPRLKLYFQEIESSGNRLLSLLNNLLDLSKMEAEMMNYVMTENNLRSVVDAALDHYHALAEEKGIGVSLHDSLDGCTVVFDRDKIFQVLGNLLNNAIKYTPSNSTISVRMRMGSGRNVEVSVCDEGVGIPHNELNQVFDKFKQSSRTRSGAGGTGLGLAICKQIISEHKGVIWAENVTPGGTRVCFTLPLKQE